MRFFTQSECIAWCTKLLLPLNESGVPIGTADRSFRLRCVVPEPPGRVLWLARYLEDILQPRGDCLVWITGFGIFPSSENNHLYYRLRQSYFDHRLLSEAPGHLCLDYQRAEVVTLLYLGMLYSWDMHIIPCAGFGHAFLSHDSGLHIALGSPAQIENAARALTDAEIVFERKS